MVVRLLPWMLLFIEVPYIADSFKVIDDTLFIVFPNSSMETIKIELVNINSVPVEIYTITGKLIKNIKINSKLAPDCSPFVYFILLFSLTFFTYKILNEKSLQQ